MHRTPLEPGPPIPFEIGADGRLLGVTPGSGTLLASDDGRFLAHPRTNLTGLEIYVADLDRREFRSCCRLGTRMDWRDFGCSGDGSRVSLLATSEGRQRFLVIDVPRAALLEIEGPFGSLDWSSLSRDGRFISYLEDHQLRVIDVEKREVVRLELPERTVPVYPMISADGKRIASLLQESVAVKGPDGEEAMEVTTELALLDLKARTWRRLARIAGSDHYPLVGPGGRRVTFISSIGGDPWLHVADLASERILPIAPCNASSRLRRLADDGETLVYAIHDEIWTTSLATGASRLLHSLVGHSMDSASVTADGRRVLYRGQATNENRRLGYGFYALELRY